MKVLEQGIEIEEQLALANRGVIGLVPTMGALHEGHLSLVDRARRECDTVVVSIFVNPTQFNDKNDLKNYPRMVDQDLALLEMAGADIVYVPSVEDIYPTPDTRVFDFGTIDKVMEGVSRPGHFNGVAQVVSRLFDIVKPDKAYFGEKDFQQIAVIKAMVAQLGYKIEIVSCVIVRDLDGLALSSRNLLLTPEHRAVAPVIYKTLKEGVAMMEKATVDDVIKYVTAQINKNPLLEVVYFNIINADTLINIESWDEASAIQGCIVVQAGSVRLIDNIRFV